jgi:hypothetical protein
MESQFYYAGLPSSPPLVGRSSITPWELHTGPYVYNIPKVLRTVGRHEIKDVWEGNLSCKVIEYLDSKKVAWTSIDVVRIGYVEESFRPVILWIGVQPKSLSIADGTQVAHSCQEILVHSGITDVDVEIRESTVTLLGGPKLLMPSTFSSDPTVVDVRIPLTSTLGLPISGKLTPWAEGTGGFFIAEGGGSKRLFLVTARHVIFQPDKNDNETFEHKSPSAPHREVILLSDTGFKKFLDSIQFKIGSEEFMKQNLEWSIANVKDVAGNEAEKERKKDELAKEKEALEALNTFYQDVSTHWASPDQRMLGHIIYSPPIKLGFGTEQYTQDFAVIEIDLSKIDATNFEGNVIDLGTKIPPYVLIRTMYPFQYPEDRLLRLKGTIPDEDMRHPPTLDHNGDPCLIVVKRGHATGLTVGRANDVRSCVRNYYEDGTTDFSMEWAILPYNRSSRAFSSPGDSGAVVADVGGRIGGIIIGGTGWATMDITYVTSINSVMEGIKVKFPNAHLNPDLRA